MVDEPIRRWVVGLDRHHDLVQNLVITNILHKINIATSFFYYYFKEATLTTTIQDSLSVDIRTN